MKNSKSSLLVSEIALSYATRVAAKDRPKISRSDDAYTILKSAWDPSKIELQEAFKLLLLNRSNRVLGLVHLSEGGVSGTIVDPKLVFVAALKANACGIILAHNHPSGNLKPSQADIHLTRKLQQGGRLLEIDVLDHLILTAHDGYYSLADGGVL